MDVCAHTWQLGSIIHDRCRAVVPDIKDVGVAVLCFWDSRCSAALADETALCSGLPLQERGFLN